nr:substrate-binding domain-containing protein [Nocardioides sp. KC13]
MAVAGAVVLAVVGTVLVIRWIDGPGSTGECLVLDVTSSTEKDDLVQRLATEFETGREVDGRCVDVNVLGLTSGAAMEALASDWDVEIVEPMFERSQTGRSRPDVWLPTSSMWTDLLELDTKKTYETLGPVTESVMVIAVPEGTADGEEVSMEWLKAKAVAGKTAGTGFVLGRDEPLWSTSGLGASMLTYNAAVRAGAAAGASVRITPEAPEDEAVNAWVRELESSVGSYGDEATTYVQDLYCGIVEPVDALVIQKQLVDLYNSGRPSGAEPDCDQLPGYGEKSHPRVRRFESHIPPEGTLAMDHPYVLMPGLSEAQRELAEEFYEFLGEDEAQAAFVEDGFERIGSVDEDDTFPQPEAEAIQRIRAEWDGVRKNSQVILLIDNSGSMNDEVAPGAAKIDRVQSAANAAIGLLAPKDELAVWTFGSSVHKTALAPMGDRISQVRAEIGAIEAGGTTTQLPAAVQAAHDALAQTNDPDNPKTKAVVLLTDGATNLTPDGSDAEENQAANDALVADIAGSESRVRIYTIPYGNSADKCLLEKVAAASGARYYGAGARESLINDVMLAVFGNFGTQAAAANLPSIEAKARIPAGDCGPSSGAGQR